MSRRAQRLADGGRVAASLRRSWRPDEPRPELPAADLEIVARLLMSTGAGGLLWHRIRCAPASGPAAADLEQAYRLQAIEAAVKERDVLLLHRRLGEAGIEAVYFKGWVAALYYPERFLRPYADVDCLVRPEQRAAAQSVLDGLQDLRCGVDLHSSALYGRSVDELFARARTGMLGGETLRVVHPADHFRILAMHFLKHGAWRPLWLVDISAALEAEPLGSEWETCLRGDRLAADWIGCAAAAAHHLLGADLAATPFTAGEGDLPGWLLPAIVRQWGMGGHGSSTGQVAPSLAAALRHPLRTAAELGRHWKNPVEASVEMHAPFDARPRLPLQLLATVMRLPSVARRATRAPR